MATPAQPIAGNQSFIKVDTIAEHLRNLNATSCDIVNVNAVTVNADQYVQTGKNTYTTVLGYAPIEFSTQVAGTSYELMKTPGIHAATSVIDPNLLQLPGGCTVHRVVVTNNGTTLVGGTSYTIGSHPVSSGLNITPSVVQVDQMPIATVNLGGSVGGTTGVTELALGTAGQSVSTSTLAGQLQGATNNLVSVTVNGTNNVSGSLLVYITYSN